MKDNNQLYNLLGMFIFLIWVVSYIFAFKLPQSKPNIVVNNKSRLRRAVISGFVFTTFALSILIFTSILDQESSFSFTSMGVGIIIILPFQIMVTLGSYHHYIGTEMAFEWFG